MRYADDGLIFCKSCRETERVRDYGQRKTTLRNYLQGWMEYFNYADMDRQQGRGYRLMASPSSAHVHLEIVEETKDKGEEPHPTRH